MLHRRNFALGITATAWAGAARAEEAESFPSRPIRIVIPFAAGGGSDVIVRPVAQALGERLKGSVIVDNRAGASGYIGAQFVKTSPPDGYTLLMGFDGTMVVAPHLVKAPFDSVADFEPITKLCDANLVLGVNPALGAGTVKDLIALSRARPEGLTYGSAGVGTTGHLAGELLALRSGMQLKHIPYKGGAQALADVVSGQVQLFFTTIPTLAPFVRDGRLKAVAMTGDRRASAMPDVPTMAEAGVTGYSVWSWYSLLAPARTPKAIIDKLQREVAAILATAEVRDRYLASGFEPSGNTPQEFGRQLRADLALWAKVVTDAKIKAD